MNLIFTPPNSLPVWPYSLARLRADNPRVSFSISPTADDMAPFGVSEVIGAQRPDDSRTERVEEVHPELVAGAWHQRWAMRDATPAEIAAWDEAHAPDPNWTGFLTALLESPLLGAAQIGAQEILQAQLPAAEGIQRERLLRASTALNSLPALLLAAATPSGDPEMFVGAWVALRQAGLVSPDVATAMTQLAAQFSLPARLIDALGASG